MQAMKVTMIHNPRCETSRNVLTILRERGIEPEIIEYLKTPLTRDEIAALVKEMGVPVRDIVRWKQKEEVATAGIGEASSDAALLDAMARYPVLLNRPIVTTPKGVKLCRPSEAVNHLLD
jgi:arsenate reductase (glutaredoxin)